MASNRIRLLLALLLIICNGPFFASSMEDEASKEVSEEESSSRVESENGEHTAPIEDGPDEVEVEGIGETPSSIEEIMKPSFRKSERKSEAKVSIEATYPRKFKDKVFSNKNAPLCDDENLECCATSVFSCVPGAIQKDLTDSLACTTACCPIGQCAKRSDSFLLRSEVGVPSRCLNNFECCENVQETCADGDVAIVDKDNCPTVCCGSCRAVTSSMTTLRQVVTDHIPSLVLNHP